MGRSVGQRPWPSTTCRSLWQTPVAAVRTRTSRPDGLSISTDSIVSGSWGLRKPAAVLSLRVPPLWRLPPDHLAHGPSQHPPPAPALQPWHVGDVHWQAPPVHGRGAG